MGFLQELLSNQAAPAPWQASGAAVSGPAPSAAASPMISWPGGMGALALEAGGPGDDRAQTLARQQAAELEELPLSWGAQPMVGQMDSNRGALEGGLDASACVPEAITAGWVMMGGDMDALGRVEDWGASILADDPAKYGSGVFGLVAQRFAAMYGRHAIDGEVRGHAEQAMETIRALQAVPRDEWTEADRSRLVTAVHALADASEDFSLGHAKNDNPGVKLDTAGELRDLFWGEHRPEGEGGPLDVAFVKRLNADGDPFVHAILAGADGSVARDAYPGADGSLDYGDLGQTFEVTTSERLDVGQGRML